MATRVYNPHSLGETPKHTPLSADQGCPSRSFAGRDGHAHRHRVGSLLAGSELLAIRRTDCSR